MNTQAAFSDLRSDVSNVWSDVLSGLEPGRIVVALMILLLAYLLRKPVSTFVLRRLLRMGSAQQGDGRTVLFHVLHRPMRLLTSIIGMIVITQLIVVSPPIKDISASVTRTLAAILIFWSLYLVIGPIVTRLDQTRPLGNLILGTWFARMGRALTAILGLAAILEIWGLHVGSMLAGLGIFGAAVALGAQDVFKNMIAGAFIIAERRFESGDWIKADGIVEGTVDTIGFRTTKIQRFDLAPAYVPNSQLSDNPVTNFSQMPHRQISWIIGLDYASKAEQLRQIRDGIEAYVKGNADYVQTADAPLFVRVDSFGDSAINMMVYCFTRTTDRAAWLKVKEELAFAISDIVAKAGSDFAFPSQSLYVQSWPKGTEFFPQPAAQSGMPATG